jgi:hypothetical protein
MKCNKTWALCCQDINSSFQCNIHVTKKSQLLESPFPIESAPLNFAEDRSAWKWVVRDIKPTFPLSKKIKNQLLQLFPSLKWNKVLQTKASLNMHSYLNATWVQNRGENGCIFPVNTIMPNTASFMLQIITKRNKRMSVFCSWSFQNCDSQ